MPELIHHHRKGIVALTAATLFFAVMDMALKLLSEHYPSFQVVFIRALSSLPILVFITPFFGGFKQLRTRRLAAHVLRGILGLFMLTLVVYSFRQLSLAYAYALFFAGPLFITLLSVPFLGEKVGVHRWIAVITGFCGVLVIANPQGPGAFSLAALAALLAALCYALIALTMRRLSSTESSISISFYFLVVLAIGAGAASSFNWEAIQWRHWPVFLTIGVAGTGGMLSLATAFRMSQASAIAPFEYTALLWAVVLDFIVWHEIPNLRLYVGGAIIIASGVYILHREHIQQRRLKQSAAQQSSQPTGGDQPSGNGVTPEPMDHR